MIVRCVDVSTAADSSRTTDGKPVTEATDDNSMEVDAGGVAQSLQNVQPPMMTRTNAGNTAPIVTQETPAYREYTLHVPCT